MATVFRRKLGPRWVLDGKRVAKSTPGAKAHRSLSREWYGLVKGEYVKLSPLRDVAEQMLRKRMRESEERPLRSIRDASPDATGGSYRKVS